VKVEKFGFLLHSLIALFKTFQKNLTVFAIIYITGLVKFYVYFRHWKVSGVIAGEVRVPLRISIKPLTRMSTLYILLLTACQYLYRSCSYTTCHTFVFLSTIFVIVEEVVRFGVRLWRKQWCDSRFLYTVGNRLKNSQKIVTVDCHSSIKVRTMFLKCRKMLSWVRP